MNKAGYDIKDAKQLVKEFNKREVERLKRVYSEKLSELKNLYEEDRQKGYNLEKYKFPSKVIRGIDQMKNKMISNRNIYDKYNTYKDLYEKYGNKTKKIKTI